MYSLPPSASDMAWSVPWRSLVVHDSLSQTAADQVVAISWQGSETNRSPAEPKEASKP